jgi:hypothetical protein
MKKIKSRYRLFGGFGLLLGMNLLFFFLTFLLVTGSKINYQTVDLYNDKNAQFAYGIILGLNLLFLSLFASQLKYIIITNEGITFINPLLPIFRKTFKWTDFDYYMLTEENSRYNSYEAVWFIKNNKLKRRFSSFYYSNYQDLKRQIRTQKSSKIKYSPLSQLFISLRIQKVNNKILF